MTNINKYVKEFQKIFYGEIGAIRGYGKVYRNTNERLAKLLSSYNFQNKNVLSVVASSDQVFSSYYLGASNVDTFDSNIFAYFYFFLKKWNLMKYKKSYISAKNTELIDCLEEHNNTDEELFAYEFWKKVFEKIRSPLYYSNFFYRDVADRTLPYDKDEETLANMIYDKSPNFTNLDLFSKIKIDKKYQIIILSNILEYMYEISDPRLELLVSDNLDKLLTDDGIIISSNLLDYHYASNPIFEDKFIYEEGPKDYSKFYDRKIPICYTYKRRH